MKDDIETATQPSPNQTRPAPRYFEFGALVICALLSIAGANPLRSESEATPAQFTQMHDDAVQAFQAQRYSAAYGRFAALADEGHAPSALMALAMVSHGPSMFGSEWSATPGQVRRWSAMTAREVREHGSSFTEYARGE